MTAAPEPVQVGKLVLHRAPGDAGILGDTVGRHGLAAVGEALDGDVEQAGPGFQATLVQFGARPDSVTTACHCSRARAACGVGRRAPGKSSRIRRDGPVQRRPVGAVCDHGRQFMRAGAVHDHRVHAQIILAGNGFRAVLR